MLGNLEQQSSQLYDFVGADHVNGTHGHVEIGGRDWRRASLAATIPEV